MPKKFMVHHGDVEKALRNLKRYMQYECRVINKKEFFKKPSDIDREAKIALSRRLKRSSRK